MNITAKTQKILLGNTTSGNEVLLDVIKIKHSESGPRVYIQAGTHGTEIAGIPVVWELVGYLKKHFKAGEVTLVPCSNPWGMDAKFGGAQVGYINHNGSKHGNWNRIFIDLVKQNKKGFEEFCKSNKGKTEVAIIQNYTKFLKKTLNDYKEEMKKNVALTKECILAATLQMLSVDADVLIDFHTGGDCLKYIYYFSHQKESVKRFGFSDGIEVPYEFHGVFDEGFIYPWYELKKKGLINSIPKEAYTPELHGDSYSDAEDVEADLQSTTNFLASIGMCEKSDMSKTSVFATCKMKDVKRIYSPTGGIMHTPIQAGVVVKKGDVLAKICEKGRQIKIHSPYDGKVFYVGSNHAVETGDAIFSLMINQTLF